MSRGRKSAPLYNGDVRKKYGSLTTWENAEGKTITLHRTGQMVAALRDAAATVELRDPTFRLVSYCTPETIHSDLLGLRSDFVKPEGSNHWSHGKSQAAPLPEQVALGRIGRGDLLHPRFANRGRDWRA
jgi:hypothetical protein